MGIFVGRPKASHFIWLAAFVADGLLCVCPPNDFFKTYFDDAEPWHIAVSAGLFFWFLHKRNYRSMVLAMMFCTVIALHEKRQLLGYSFNPLPVRQAQR